VEAPLDHLVFSYIDFRGSLNIREHAGATGGEYVNGLTSAASGMESIVDL
jgi:hypothetical protein